MKFNLVVLTIALSLSLVACGGNSNKKAKKTDEPAKTENMGQSRVVAGPNGELRVMDVNTRTEKHVVVGADGKLEVVEKQVPCRSARRTSSRCCR